MIASLVTSLAKKSAVTAIAGVVVVFTATFALAATNDDPYGTADDSCAPVTSDEGTEIETETDADSHDGCEAETPAETTPAKAEETDDGTDDDDESGTEHEDVTADEAGDFDLGAVLEDGEEPDYRNHGEAVSEAAKSCEPGPGHGACVSAIAKSDLGKKHSDGEDEAVAADEDDADEVKDLGDEGDGGEDEERVEDKGGKDRAKAKSDSPKAKGRSGR